MSRPSAPGVSVDISGAAKVAARRIRRLGKAVLIDFTTKGETENELMAWYRSRSDSLVRALQLRQEREGPYFHQFVVFELKDNGGLFRIDRRLRPDEDAPMNSLKDEGIPSYDTIEPVINWDDPLFPASDCLISIEFKVDVYLALILKICRAIQRHPLAKVYTLQRYNCYFFAQTIMLWVACGATDWASIRFWPQEWVSTLNSNKGFLQLNKSAHERADYSEVAHMSTPVTAQFTYKGHIIILTLARKTNLPQPPHRKLYRGSIVAPSWEIEDVEMLHNKIDASVQHLIETYWKEGPTRRALCKYLMDKTLSEISEDLHSSSPSMPRFNKIFIEVRSVQETQLGPAQTGALRFQTSIYKPHLPFIPRNEVRSPKRVLESFLIHLSNGDQWEEFIAKRERWKESRTKLRPIGQLKGTINDASIDSFEQSMVVEIVYGAAVQQDTPEGTTPKTDLKDIPRYRRAQNSIFRWRKAKQGQQMTPATIIEMQKYLVRLIDAHSIRVERYKWATRAVATDVASDIRRVMDEVWDKLIE